MPLGFGLARRRAKDPIAKGQTGGGNEGYQVYLDFKPDLVLTDIQMPGENGLEFVQHIPTHNPAVRTIYMSGDLDRYLSPLEEEKRKYLVSLLEKLFSKRDLRSLLYG